MTLDSTFAEAWARLAATLTTLYSNSTPDPALAIRARDAVNRALALAPEAAAAHVANVAYQYAMQHDPAKAMEAAAAGLKVAPNDAELLARAASVERALGRTEEALAHLERAKRIDPAPCGSPMRCRTS